MSSRPSRGAARLAAILDALPDALVLVNANGTVVNANTIALEAFEAPGTALVGRGLLDLLPQFDSRLIPGSMRRPDHMDPQGRTKPTRMIARRTDGREFPVEVTSANLENGQQAYDGYGYTGDELLMLVVRDLSGTVDTEAELARSQRQTEMILRAASEGVIGTDTDGRIVLVNPAAAQILGYRASDLGGKELHTLVLHSRPDGSPFPYSESPLSDTLRSGRKHRVRGQVVFAKNGDMLPVDLTTAPVRDGDQLVGAVLTFTDRRPFDALADEKAAADKEHEAEIERLAEEHASDLTALRQQHVTKVEELTERHAEELAAAEERYAALAEREGDRYETLAAQETDRYETLAARYEQLAVLLGRSLRGPLDELRRELAALAADDAGQLWPEANQVLHHLSAGYARITTLIDNVLGYQLLDGGGAEISRAKVMLDAVVAAGVDGAIELIGPGRVQFAVHAPPIEAEVDPQRLATALAHLIADVAGVDATGNTPVSAGGYMDSTVVVAAAQRGEVVRIEVRGPYAGGDPVHEPIVRGIVRAHGGVLQTHEVPGMSGSAYVLEVPLGAGAGAVPVQQQSPVALDPAPAPAPAPAPVSVSVSVSAPVSAPAPAPAPAPAVDPAPAAEPVAVVDPVGVVDPGAGAEPGADPGAEELADHTSGGGRRRARRSSVDAFLESEVPGASDTSGGTEAGAPTGRRRRGRPAEETGAVVAESTETSGGTGRRRGRPAENTGGQGIGVPPAVTEGAVVTAAEHAAGTAAVGTGLGAAVPPGGVPVSAAAVPPGGMPALPAVAGADGGAGAGAGAGADDGTQATGRRRRALAAAAERATAQEASAGPRPVFALPPADADRAPEGNAAQGPVPMPVPGPGQAPMALPAAAPMPAAPVPAVPVPVVPGAAEGRHDVAPHDQADDHTPPQPHPTEAPTGRRRRAMAQPGPQPGQPLQPGQPAPSAEAGGMMGTPGQGMPVQGAPMQPVPAAATPAQAAVVQPQPLPVAPGQPVQVPPGQPVAAQAVPVPAVAQPVAAPQQLTPQVPVQAPAPHPGAPQPGPVLPQQVPAPAAPAQPQTTQATPLPAEQPLQPAQPRAVAQPLPAEAAAPAPAPAPAMQAPAVQPLAPAPAPTPHPAVHIDPNSTQGRAFSVRTLGQGVPFARSAQAAQAQAAQPGVSATPPHGTSAGRRRKLGTPPDPAAGRPHPTAEQPPGQPAAQPQPSLAGAGTGTGTGAGAATAAPGQPRLTKATDGAGRSYAIGAPDENAAEGPEPLDGPGGAVEVADAPRPQPLDDELPPEPLDNPRRLLVWPAPDVLTQQALSDRGYRPVIVHSREEVDAQIAAFPAALFVDPLTGPITRTALQSLRQAAVAAEVPVMVTAGLGQATREAAYGADPAVLLKALAPRDSEQHPPRVLLIEEHAEIALALTAALERRGMQVARAASDADAVMLAGQLRPNLVVMDLMQMQRHQAGIVDWLRANGQLNRTPLVVYTAAVDPVDLPRLASGETVLFLAERSTTPEVQARIVDLLARIGTN